MFSPGNLLTWLDFDYWLHIYEMDCFWIILYDVILIPRGLGFADLSSLHLRLQQWAENWTLYMSCHFPISLKTNELVDILHHIFISQDMSGAVQFTSVIREDISLLFLCLQFSLSNCIWDLQSCFMSKIMCQQDGNPVVPIITVIMESFLLSAMSQWCYPQELCKISWVSCEILV